MTNMNNFGILEGIVTPDKAGSSNALTVFPLDNGAARISLSLSVKDNFKSRVSKEELDAMGPEVAAKKVDSDLRMYRSQRITVGKYLPADNNKKPMGIDRYQKLRPGDRVQVMYSVKTSSFVKDGQTQYRTTLEIEDYQVIAFAQPKAAAQA